MNFRNVSTEKEENVEVEKDELVEKVLEKYNAIDKRLDKFDSIELGLPVLTPAQINLFFQIAVKNLKGSSWHDDESIFLNKLIYDSWSDGYNNFKLKNPGNNKFLNLFKDLKGEPKNPISITLYGEGGINFAWGSINCIYDLQGNFEGSFSRDSNNCIYNIKGKIKDDLSWNYSSNSYIFFKKVKGLGNRYHTKIKGCTFDLYDGIDEVIWDSIKDCTFKTHDSENYEKIVSSFREFKSQDNDSKSKWHEKINNSFKDEIIEETFFYGYLNGTGNELKYNKIQLIK